MSAFEIISLIISGASLLATIGVSLTVFYLDKRSLERQRQHEISESAKRFIVENADERGFLPWAVVAAGCFPQNKHIRKIYNEFTLLDDEVKKEVLRQTKNDIPLIQGDEWIDGKIQLVIDAANELDLGDTFLYDGAKYFHRLYEDKKREFDDGYWDDDFEDVFGYERLTLFRRKGYIPFSRYIDDYLYIKYKEPKKFSKEWPKPFDYLLNQKAMRSTSDEGFVCCWVARIVEETICYSKKYLGYESRIATDAAPKTFEDRYFQVIFELFFFNKKQSDLES